MQSYISHPAACCSCSSTNQGGSPESDPGSTFNSFINDARLIDKASERDHMTIIVDSSVISLMPFKCGHRLIRFDLNDGKPGGIKAYHGLKGKRKNFLFSTFLFLARIHATGIGPRSGSSGMSVMR